MASSPSWALERRPPLEAFLGIRASRRRLLSQPERTAQDLAVAHDEVIAQNRLRSGSPLSLTKAASPPRPPSSCRSHDRCLLRRPFSAYCSPRTQRIFAILYA